MAESKIEHRPVLGVMSTENISSTDDLNNYTTMGCWKIGGDLPVHAPTGSIWAQLYVFIVGTSMMQIINNGNTLWIRNGSTLSNVWYEWTKFIGTMLSTNVTGADNAICYFKKSGNVVWAYSSGKYTTAKSAGANLFNIPTGFRPTLSGLVFNMPACRISNGTASFVRIALSDTTIKVSDAILADDFVQFSICYIVD